MQKIILIKYGELSTKKDNRNFFIKTLNDNIKKVLNEKDIINYDFGRMIIIPNDNDFECVINKLKKVFGIHKIYIAYIIDKNLDNIKESIINILKEKDFKTFKVDVKRSDKTYPVDGMELRKELGSFILQNISNKKVLVNNPDIIVNVEIRLKEALIYFDGISGLGGYPVGTLGKGLLMLSGGIDSPVAGYLAIKRGVRLEAVYFESPPHTSEQALNKVKELAKKLALYNNCDIKLHIINFTDIQESIYKNISHEYLITIMRRMMYRISAIIASRINAKVLVNGESIGQVASQTLSSMSAINEVVKIPVIRPLCCFDKLEIIDIAKKIDTYEISILPFEDCCTIFVPDHPTINPIKKKCEEYENLIPYKELIYNAVKTKKTIVIKDTFEYKDLL